VALKEISERMMDLRKTSGPDSVYYVGSSKHNNEQAYLLRKFVSFWGTNNTDHHSPNIKPTPPPALLLATATSASPHYRGFYTTPGLTLASPLVAGQTYHWRVDIAAGGELIPGPVQSFQVANLIPSVYRVDAATVRGHDNLARDIALSSLAPSAGWRATASAPWIRLVASAGATPAPLRLSLDASALDAGVHEGSVTLTGDTETIVIPVRLQVDPLQITRFASRPGSTKVYAISGPQPSQYETDQRAYLLEIDNLREKISRVVPAGRGATDLAVHEADDRVYVTNWKDGRILGIDLASFTLARTYETTPFAGSGYGSADSYVVSAGGPGRLIFEAADQSISVTLFDTDKGLAVDPLMNKTKNLWDLDGLGKKEEITVYHKRTVPMGAISTTGPARKASAAPRSPVSGQINTPALHSPSS
jgi:hypothetical protein